MPTRWCVNFDRQAGQVVLRHGLANGMWLMQYQYSHDGYAFQGYPKHLPHTRKNWNRLTEVKAGDSLVAYLKESRFYGVGEVIEPKSRARHSRAMRHTDTVARTVQDRRHLFFDGVVQYTDAPVLYEDFTEEKSWTCPVEPRRPNQPRVWLYPQRIDVSEWKLVRPAGVHLKGLAADPGLPEIRRAVFRISEAYFQRIVKGLGESGSR